MSSHAICLSLVCTRTSSVCQSHLLVCHPYVTSMCSYVISMSLVCTRMSSICHSFVIRMYLHVIRMLCTGMSSIYHSYVTRSTCMLSVFHSRVLVCYPYVTNVSLVCHPYVSRMYSYVIRMSIVCTRMSSVCHLFVLVCQMYVTRMWFYHKLKETATFPCDLLPSGISKYSIFRTKLLNSIEIYF